MTSKIKKTFWKAVKPVVINKIKVESKITLTEKQALLLKSRLDPGPKPWKNWTQEKLDPEKSRPWKMWSLKNLDPEQLEPWKTLETTGFRKKD